LSDLAVDNERDYENRALLFAHDPQAYRDVRAHLADNRMSLPLFDNVRFTAELGALFSRMEQRWKQGLPPQALPAEPLTLEAAPATVAAEMSAV
jgi:hypothetical protein